MEAHDDNSVDRVAWPPANRFTELVGCELPLQQGGHGGVTTVALAVAVAREGALGMLAAAGFPPDAVESALTDAVGSVRRTQPAAAAAVVRELIAEATRA